MLKVYVFLLILIVSCASPKKNQNLCHEKIQSFNYLNKSICFSKDKNEIMVVSKINKWINEFTENYPIKKKINLTIVEDESGPSRSGLTINNFNLTIGVFPGDGITDSHRRVFLHELSHMFLLEDKNSIFFAISQNSIFKETLADLMAISLNRYVAVSKQSYRCSRMFLRSQHVSYKSDQSNLSNDSSFFNAKACCDFYKVEDKFCGWINKKIVIKKKGNKNISLHKSGLPFLGFFRELKSFDNQVVLNFLKHIKSYENVFLTDYNCTNGEYSLKIKGPKNDIWSNIFKDFVKKYGVKASILYEKYYLEKAFDVIKKEQESKIKMYYVVKAQEYNFEKIQCNES